MADRIGETTFVTGRGAGLKGIRRPKPVTRPGDEDKGRIGHRGEATTEDVVTYLDQYKPRQAQSQEPSEATA